MSSVLDVFIPQLEKLRSAKAGVKAVLAELVKRVNEAPTLAQAQAIANEFGAQSDEIAEATVANTPSE